MQSSVGLGRKEPWTDSKKQKPLSEKPRGWPDLGMSLPKALSLCEVRECPLENQNCQDTSQAHWGPRLPGLAGWAEQVVGGRAGRTRPHTIGALRNSL